MNKQNIIIGLTVLLFILLLLSSHVLALESSSYAIKRDVIASTGGQIQSTNYDVNFTAGQSVIGFQTSNSYRGHAGYWSGGTTDVIAVYLPILIKN